MSPRLSLTFNVHLYPPTLSSGSKPNWAAPVKLLRTQVFRLKVDPTVGSVSITGLRHWVTWQTMSTASPTVLVGLTEFDQFRPGLTGQQGWLVSKPPGMGGLGACPPMQIFQK